MTTGRIGTIVTLMTRVLDSVFGGESWRTWLAVLKGAFDLPLTDEERKRFDMMMRVMDGWTFREEQRKLPALASIPVLTVTADGDARGKAASIQAAGYIAKPLQINALLDEVERICALPES
jgi:CheY-like chemotaxis protein